MSSLKVNILPQYSILPHPSVACVGSTTFLSLDMTAVNGFTWNVSPNVTPFPIVGPNNVTITWPSPGLYTVSVFPNAPNPFCNDTLYALINVVFVPPPDSIVGPLNVCPGSTYTYTGYGSTPGTGFMWNVTNGTPSSFTGNPISVTWGPTGPFTLSLSQFQINTPFCSSAPITLTVTPLSVVGPLLITGPNGCINDVDSYSISPAQPAGTNFTWTISPPAAGSVILGQGTSNVNIQWNNTPATVTITCGVTVCGNTTFKTKVITLTAPIQPTITQIGILCPGVMATLDAGSGFSTYAWSTTQTTQTILISSPGVYTVTTTDVNGCMAIDSYEAFAVPGPVASISTPGPTVFCIPSTGSVTLYALTGVGYIYQWYDGVNPIPLATNSTYVHTNTNVVQTFNYTVKVTNANGCMATSNLIVVTQLVCMGGGNPCIPDAYTLSISAMNNMPICNDVTFTVTSSNVTLQSWAFGDPFGNSYTGPISNPTHTYSKAGCYSAVLSGTVPSSITPPTCVVQANVSVCVPVAADFTCTNMCRTYTFMDISTYLPGEVISNYFWDFGDGNTLSGTNPTPMHTFAACGPDTVVLTVTTMNGCQSTFSKIINPPCDPNANFTMAPNPACVGDAIVYTPATTSGIVSYLWSFGDASTNGSQMPSHAYIFPGTYQVILMLTDNNGCTGADTNSITDQSSSNCRTYCGDGQYCYLCGRYRHIDGSNRGGIYLFMEHRCHNTGHFCNYVRHL